MLQSLKTCRHPRRKRPSRRGPVLQGRWALPRTAGSFLQQRAHYQRPRRCGTRLEHLLFVPFEHVWMGSSSYRVRLFALHRVRMLRGISRRLAAKPHEAGNPLPLRRLQLRCGVVLALRDACPVAVAPASSAFIDVHHACPCRTSTSGGSNLPTKRDSEREHEVHTPPRPCPCSSCPSIGW